MAVLLIPVILTSILLGCGYVEELNSELAAQLTPAPSSSPSTTSQPATPSTPTPLDSAPPNSTPAGAIPAGTEAPGNPPASTVPGATVPAAAERDVPLTVAPIAVGIPDYNRREWRHWRDEDRDCQDARQEALIAESTGPVAYKTSKQCKVVSGLWVGPYTGEVIDDPGKLDVDHMVPLANAHRSGGWAWDRDRKAAYANDLTYPGHLIAVVAAANRAKGSKGPEEWRPPDMGYWCEYATHWTEVKNRWELSATEEEREALEEMLGYCVAAPTSDSGLGSGEHPVP